MFPSMSRKKISIFLMILIMLLSLLYLKIYYSLPGEMVLISGEENIYNLRSPVKVKVSASKDNIIKVNGSVVDSKGFVVKLSGPVTFLSDINGSLTLNVRLFGILPLRTLKVDTVENKKVVPCGNTIGVKLRLDGILIVGVSDVKGEDGLKVPAAGTGLRAGDMIVKVNERDVNDIDSLIDAITKSNGEKLNLRYRRDDIFNNTYITPVKASEDSKYHIGLWVRDSTAGIGTLTFYEPSDRSFAALGHGITDVDTGTLMTVSSGEIFKSSIFDIKKGTAGIPGELKGVFNDDTNIIGNISFNSDCGIFGKMNDDTEIKNLESIAVGTRTQISTGKAEILANIEGNKVEKFEISIEKINRQNYSGSKGMIIKITDERLLEKTGGIVQGMSGCPIIQNNRLIGAITHVLVNDPSKGYGILIESMIKNLLTSISQNTKDSYNYY